MKEADIFLNFTTKIEEFTKSPEKYLSFQEAQAEEIKRLIGKLYNFTKKNERKSKTSETLLKLVIRNVDEEQIWQQIELQNNSICDKVVSDIAHLLAKKDLTFSLKNEKNSKKIRFDDDFKICNDEVKDHKKEETKESKSEDKKEEEKHDGNKNDLEDEEDEGENDDIEDEENEEDEDKFVENEEEDEFDENEEGEDEFVENEEDEDEFVENEEDEDEFVENEEDEDEFVENKDDEFVENEEDENKNEKFKKNEQDNEIADSSYMENAIGDDNYISNKPSTFEARQERLKSKIKALENEALKEKPWQLKGEVTARSRPKNSLLEEYVEFDIAARPAPVLTEKSTLKLEDIILQRIKDKAWDDVVRKIKPIEGDLEYKKRLVLDQEKSKLSLAQIYEQEYLNQLDKKNESVIDKPEVEASEHKEIRTMMNKLFAKLDALSNFHFTPKQVKEDVTVVSNIPAIHMEEVAPVATSDAALLAPEEVKPKYKGELIGKSERTATDKKRERRRKKIKQKLKFEKIEAKEKEKLEKDSKGKRNKKISQRLLQKITKSRNVLCSF